jgi:hypothetical protein
VIPVILGSDKTHLTVLSGDKKAWPLYLSIGNIKSRIRNSQNQRAWLIIGYIPIVHFEDHIDLQTTLINRLFHQCVEFILKSLIPAGNNGILMADSRGDVRRCYPRIAAYLADYPEQILINVAAGNNSPITLAGYHQLDDAKPHPPRTKEWILGAIAEISQMSNPNDVAAYLTAAKAKGLNGVHKPFWRNMPGYQPEIVICPDILHGVHRFWCDHILLWTRRLVGDAEMDRRLRVLQPVRGYKSYLKGIKNIAQWTGREDRELQRTLVAVVAGAPAIDAKVMRNLRAFHDFLYLVQYRSHTSSSLEYIREGLETFHKTKTIYIEKGARRGKNGTIDHFRIPKLAGLHAYLLHIPEMGTSPQYSTDITEACHQAMAKAAYRATNHKDYPEQMCRFLDRKEKITFLRELLAWAHLEMPRQRLMAEISSYSPGYQRQSLQIMKYLQGEAAAEQMGRKQGVKHGIWLNKKPNHIYTAISTLIDVYRLPDLPCALRAMQRLQVNTVSVLPLRSYVSHHHIHSHSLQCNLLMYGTRFECGCPQYRMTTKMRHRTQFKQSHRRMKCQMVLIIVYLSMWEKMQEGLR